MDAHVRKGGRAALPPFHSAANVTSSVGKGEMQMNLEYVLVEWARMSAKVASQLSPICIRPLMRLQRSGKVK